MSLNLIRVDFNHLGSETELGLLRALDATARIWDDDFNGKNGEDCLCIDAKDGGYSCNADFVFDYIKNDIETGYYNKYTVNTIRHSTIVEDYLNMWLGEDDFYSAYTYCQVTESCFVIAWNDKSYY